MTTCPHCGHEIEQENAVTRWRRLVVQLPGRTTLLKEARPMPEPYQCKNGVIYYRKYGSIPLVIVEDA